MRTTLLAIGALLISQVMVMPGALAQGQGVMVTPQGVRLTGFGIIDVEKTIEHWAERERSATTGEMNLQVELLEAVCELDQDETEKLRNLVSVVANRRLLNGRKQLREFIYESNLADRDPDTPAIDEAFEDKLTPFKASTGEDGVIELATRFDRPLSERPLWKKVLKSSLTPAQWEKYETHCRDRNRMFVESAVTQAIASLDSKVFLNSEQRNELRKKAMDHSEPQVTLGSPSTLAQAEELTRPWFGDRTNLKRVLRESQLKRLAEIDAARNMRGVSWSR